jgi:hypothetical protein
MLGSTAASLAKEISFHLQDEQVRFITDEIFTGYGLRNAL